MIIIGMLVFTGCIPKPLDIELPEHEPRLVISSQVIPDNIILVSLSKSFSALEMDPDNDSLTDEFLDQFLVSHGRVVIQYLDKTDTLLKLANGLYTALNIQQIPNETYTLYAYDSITGLEASSSCIMLPRVKFDTISPLVDKKNNDTTVSMVFRFTDPPGNNWYMINYYINHHDSLKDSLIVLTDLLTDKMSGGSQNYHNRILEEAFAGDSVVVTLSNISELYFKFVDARIRSGDWFSQISKEPINHPSNVNGGYGFFNMHYPDIRYFNLKEY